MFDAIIVAEQMLVENMPEQSSRAAAESAETICDDFIVLDLLWEIQVFSYLVDIIISYNSHNVKRYL